VTNSAVLRGRWKTGYYCNLQAGRRETAVDTLKVVERCFEDAGYVDARHWKGNSFTTFANK